MADTAYKFNIRNTTNDGWVNVLTETNIAMVDPSNYFLGERLDEVLYELRQAILDVGGGGPGYLGEAVHVIDSTDSTGSTDELASFSTRGGLSVAKSMFAGGSLEVTGLTTLDDDTTINGDLFMIQDISGTVNISGDGTGSITGFTDVTITGTFETNDLLVTGGVTRNFEPKSNETYNLGGAVLRWSNLYSKNVIADIITGNLTGNVTGNLTGNVTGNLTGNIDGDVTGDLTGDVTGDLIGNVTGNLTGDLIAAVTNAIGIISTGDITAVNFIGDLTGDLTGDVTGNVTGDLTGDVTGNVTGNVTGDLTGNVTGNLTGNLVSTTTNAVNLVATGDITAVNFTGNVTGNVEGNVEGNVTGNLTGNLVSTTTNAVNLVATGDIEAIDITASGDLTGDTLVVTNAGSDLIPTSGFNLGSVGNKWGNIYTNQLIGATNVESAVATIGTLNVTTLIGSNFMGDVTGDVTGNLVGNVTGNIDGNIVGDTTQITSAWDMVDDGDANDSLEVRGGMTVDKNLTVSRNIYTQDLTVAGTLTADTISFSGVMTDLTGNVLSQDGGTIILENGTNGADAVFTGSVTGDLDGNLVNDLTIFTGLSGETLETSGEATLNSLNVVNVVESNLIPLGTFTLGNTLNRWNEVYANTITGTSFLGGTFNGQLNGNLTSPITNAVEIQTSGNVGVGGDLDVTGTFAVGNLAVSTVTGDVIGDVKSQDGLVTVLDNGTDGSDAVFTGSVTGDLTGDLVAPVTTNVTATTPSTSWDNGALVVEGGVGVAGNLNVQGSIETLGNFTVGAVFDAPTFTFLNGTITGNISSTNKDTGALIITQGGLGVEENINAGGNLGVVGDAGIGGSLTVDTDLVVTGLSTLTDAVQIDGAVDINNAVDVDITGGDFNVLTDGSVILNGDVVVIDGTTSVGIGSDDINLIATTIDVSGSTTFTGDVLVTGNVDITDNLTVGSDNTDVLVINSTLSTDLISTDNTQSIGNAGNVFDEAYFNRFVSEGGNTSTDTLTGDIVTAGGVGIGENLNVFNDVSIGNDLGVTGNTTLTGTLLVNDTTQSTTINTGSIVTLGGMGIEKELFVGGQINSAGGFVGNTTGNLTGDVTGSLVGDSVEADTFTANNSLYVGSTSELAGIVTITNTTSSTDKDSGALVVQGGVGIEENLNVGGDIETLGGITIGTTFEAPSFVFQNGEIQGAISSTDKDTGALVITQGGLGVEENINAGGLLTVEGDISTTSGTIGGLTAAELLQLGHIDAVTISNTQWVYIGQMNQSVNTGSNVTFASVVSTGNISTTTGTIGGLTAAELTQLNNIDAVTISNTQWGYIGNLDQSVTTTSGVTFASVVSTGNISTTTGTIGGLTAAELLQLNNIDAVTISNTQWGYIGDMNQRVTTTDSVSFVNVTADLTGNASTASAWETGRTITLTGGVTGTSAAWDGAGNISFDTTVVGNIFDQTLNTTDDVVFNGVTVNDTTTSTNKDTGALVVEGGVGIEENLYVGGSSGIGGDLTIAGDLTVNGTTTTINTETVQVEDNIMVINYGEAGAGVTIGAAGIEIDRGSLENYQFIFDESDDTFKIGEIGSLQAVATREDTPIDSGTVIWDATTNMFVTITWLTATDSQVLLNGRKYLVGTEVEDLVLPATPTQGDTIVLHDEDDTWMSSPVTVSGNGNEIQGSLTDLILNVDGITVELVYTTSQGWKIV